MGELQFMTKLWVKLFYELLRTVRVKGVCRIICSQPQPMNQAVQREIASNMMLHTTLIMFVGAHNAVRFTRNPTTLCKAWHLCLHHQDSTSLQPSHTLTSSLQWHKQQNLIIMDKDHVTAGYAQQNTFMLVSADVINCC